MRYRLLVIVSVSCLTSFTSALAQEWTERNLIALKVSQLYYELNVGINLRENQRTADFMYLALGYGNPTRKNAWRKFLPEQQIPSGISKTLQEKLANSDTEDLFAGMVAVGWNHWFNHTLGCYVQAGWGFIADLSTGDNLTEEEKAMLSDDSGKDTFIYNTVPVEAGITFKVRKHYLIQGGVTYMWKEIPLLTMGIGYAF